MEDLQIPKKQQNKVADVDIYLTVPKCTTASEVIRVLKIDRSGKTYHKIRNIMNKYGLKFKDGRKYDDPK